MLPATSGPSCARQTGNESNNSENPEAFRNWTVRDKKTAMSKAEKTRRSKGQRGRLRGNDKQHTWRQNSFGIIICVYFPLHVSFLSQSLQLLFGLSFAFSSYCVGLSSLVFFFSPPPIDQLRFEIISFSLVCFIAYCLFICLFKLSCRFSVSL